jgi:hypothetical protein
MGRRFRAAAVSYRLLLVSKTHTSGIPSDMLRAVGRVMGSIGLWVDLFSVSVERCDQQVGGGSNGSWKYSVIVTRNFILKGS